MPMPNIPVVSPPTLSIFDGRPNLKAYSSAISIGIPPQLSIISNFSPSKFTFIFNPENCDSFRIFLAPSRLLSIQ